MSVDHEALDLQTWDRSSDPIRRSTAGDAAAAVGGKVVDVELDCQGDQRHSIAIVEVRGVRMVLVPGGTTTLGWDARRTAAVACGLRAPAERAAFERLAATYLTPERTIVLAPFLLELDPTPVETWTDDDGGADPLGAIEGLVRASGFRLPTDDEWEYAVHGGSTSLFRWGDVWPDGDPRPRANHFTGHRVPTAFGLHLLSDPRALEVVTSPLGFRGGDGGAMVDRGEAPSLSWLGFASAFRWPRAEWCDAVAAHLRRGWVRRALSIP